MLYYIILYPARASACLVRKSPRSPHVNRVSRPGLRGGRDEDKTGGQVPVRGRQRLGQGSPACQIMLQGKWLDVSQRL